MATATASTPVPQKSQADLIHDAQVRKQRRFRANVVLSWLLCWPSSCFFSVT